MATDWRDAYGEQPWDAAPPAREGRTGSILALIAVIVGLAGLGVSLYGVAGQVMPRQFTAAQQRQITDWEYGKNWRVTAAGTIFPAAVKYAPPAALDDNSGLTLDARRIGIASQASCQAALDLAAAAVLDRDGCVAVLRATYTDATDSYVVTVGAAVLPSTAQAAAAVRQLAVAGGAAAAVTPGVRPVAFDHTPAAWFTASRRQISGSMASGTYVIFYTVGYADSRPREQVTVAGNVYAYDEMTDAGEGVARAVLDVLGQPVPAPRCPGTPGC